MAADFIVPIVVTILSVGGSLLVAYLNRRSILSKATLEDASALETYQRIAAQDAKEKMDMLAKNARMGKKIDQLIVTVADLQSTITEWQAGITLLVAQIATHGEKPIWTPKPRPTISQEIDEVGD